MDQTTLDGLAHVLSDEFQEGRELLTERWDKEWLRYFSLDKDYSFYFYNMDTPDYVLVATPEEISEFTPREMMETVLHKNIRAAIWAYGTDVVGKNILEIGCGPGILGRTISRVTSSYTGIDVSEFALSIARLTSPQSCSYVHFFDRDSIRDLAKSFDFSFGRNFFIHHNYDDSLWLLRFLRDVTKDGGVILADFFSDSESLEGVRRVPASAALSVEHPSALYSFTDSAILSITKAAGLTCESIDYVPEKQCRYARLTVR